MQNNVVVARADTDYPSFPYEDKNHPLHRHLCRLMKAWGKDPDNPFADKAGAGGTVVIKPNWVTHYNMGGHGIEEMLTNTSLIKYVIDFAAAALRGSGTIIIGDAPVQGCDFEKLIAISGIDKVVAAARKRWRGIDLRVEDWRLTTMRADAVSIQSAQKHRDDYERTVASDYTLVDLGRESFLEDISEFSHNFRVSAYKKELMFRHHAAGKHEYLVTNRIKQADLFVNLPKMKTHMKAGLTGALKNIVGINGHKEYLPHYMKGAYPSGGDAYMRRHPLRYIHECVTDWLADRYAEMPAASARLISAFLDALRWGSVLCGGESTSLGSWAGNETVWRMTLDLNHILYFGEHSPKHIVTIVDGIIAGEGQGPLKPRPKRAGVLIAGENPAYIDAVVARLLGYNISRIPTVYNAICSRRSRFGGVPLSDFAVTALLDSDIPTSVPLESLPNLRFRKPRGWQRADSNT